MYEDLGEGRGVNEMKRNGKKRNNEVKRGQMGMGIVWSIPKPCHVWGEIWCSRLFCWLSFYISQTKKSSPHHQLPQPPLLFITLTFITFFTLLTTSLPFSCSNKIFKKNSKKKKRKRKKPYYFTSFFTCFLASPNLLFEVTLLSFPSFACLKLLLTKF